MNDKLQTLNEIVKLVQGSVSATEFVAAIKVLMDNIKDLRKSNETEWTLIHSSLQMLESKLKEDNSSDIASLKQEFTSLLEPKVAQMEQTITAKIAEIDAKLASVKDGEPGEDAIVDEEAIIGAVVQRIPPPVVETGDDLIEKINTAEGLILSSAIQGLDDLMNEIRDPKTGSKAGWGAHPLTVAGSGTVKSKTTRHINFKGTGVSSVVRNPDGTVDVTISGGSGGGGGTLTSETPVGTVDGVNTVFTVSNSTVQLFLNGALQQAGGGDYTLSGLTITFVSAPVSGSILTSWYFSSVAQGTPKGEAPTGTINSSNVTFTLSQTPSPAAFLQLYLGRQLQIQGVDYTLSGATITYTTAPNIALVGQHYSFYTY